MKDCIICNITNQNYFPRLCDKCNEIKNNFIEEFEKKQLTENDIYSYYDNIRNCTYKYNCNQTINNLYIKLIALSQYQKIKYNNNYLINKVYIDINEIKKNKSKI